jgi:hypothetical protein
MSRRLARHDRLVDLDHKVVGHVENSLDIEVNGYEEPEPTVVPEGILERIAADILGIETLDARASDDLGHPQVGVRSIRRALEAAYEAGRCGKWSAGDSIRSCTTSSHPTTRAAPSAATSRMRPILASPAAPRRAAAASGSARDAVHSSVLSVPYPNCLLIPAARRARDRSSSRQSANDSRSCRRRSP